MNDFTGHPASKLQQVFGNSLFDAAERVVHSGAVLEVRVLQGGGVVTGIVSGEVGASDAAKYRVYIRNLTAKMQGECSCGERGVCVHVAAVAILGMRTGGGGTGAAGVRGVARAGGSAPGGMQAAAGVQTAADSARVEPGVAQLLCYVVEKAGVGGITGAHAGAGVSAGNGAFGEFRVSVWVAQRSGSGVGSSIVPGSACAFVPRSPRAVASGSGALEFPRYVDHQDREILRALMSVHGSEGPWALRGEVGARVLLDIAATGRGYWSSLSRVGTTDGRVGASALATAVGIGRAEMLASQVGALALRAGGARRVEFAWKLLADGDQVLSWGGADALDVVMDVDPPMYVDLASQEVGVIELPVAVGVLREYGRMAAVAPERVVAVNAAIDALVGAARSRDVTAGADSGGITAIAGAGAVAVAVAVAAHDAPFPRLRHVTPVASALESLTPRLVLTADQQAVLHFVYNGVAVDGRRLSGDRESGSVRIVFQGSLREIPRDHNREKEFQSQLAGVLATTPNDAATWLELMVVGMPALQQLGWDIAVEDRFPYRIVSASQWYGDLGADLRQSAWFNLRLGVMVDGQPVNLLPALARFLQSSLDGKALEPDSSGHQVGDYWLVRLEDGRYLPIGMDRIQRIANTLVELFERNSLADGEALSLPRNQSGRLAQLAMELNGPTLRSDDSSLAALVEDLKSFSGIRAMPAPANFHGTLRPYQEEGLGWLQFLRQFRLGGVLADDMGLGKTVQTIAHIALEHASGRLSKPVLIVAPVSALGNWHHEFGRFAPTMRVHTWHGVQRRKSLRALDETQVIITAYPLLLIDSEVLLTRDFGLVILDEAQMIKNSGAKVSQMARALRAECRLCLSGTPVENHLGELWSLFDFLMPGLLGDERHFQRHYRTPIEKNGDRGRAEALSDRLAPFLLRRTKDAVAKELPPKVEIVESITLDEKQRDFYDGVRLAMHQRIQEVVRQQGLARSQITILDALLKLRQVCCDPRLVDKAGAADEAGAADGAGTAGEIVPSAKIEWLSTVLPELVAEGRRILLFSQFTSMLRLIEAVVTELGIPYCLLTGETQDRTAVVERFQTGAAPLFLISLKAGGTALNLTAADTVIHYDPWWNPAVEAQATDRAHRIGQTKSVFVYKLIAQDTVEERMLQLQADKRVLADRLYTQKSASPTALGAADLEMLLAP